MSLLALIHNNNFNSKNFEFLFLILDCKGDWWRWTCELYNAQNKDGGTTLQVCGN